MKEIKLVRKRITKDNRAFVAMVDDSDYKYLNQWQWRVNINGNSIYADRNITIDEKRITLKMHRVIVGIIDSQILVDHIDGNGLNNQRNNLRPCTKSQNGMNRGAIKNKSSKYKGVSWLKCGNKWAAEIRANNKKTYIGIFSSEEDAAKAYDTKAKELHGDFAKLNFN